jgi:hypothetical protein
MTDKVYKLLKLLVDENPEEKRFAALAPRPLGHGGGEQ